jgi:hypothetical protein
MSSETKKNLTLYIIFISIFASVGLWGKVYTDLKEIYNLTDNNIIFFSYQIFEYPIIFFNFFRLTIPVLLSVILILFYIFFSSKKNFLVNLFYVYFFSIFISLIITIDRPIDFSNTYLPILSLGAITIFDFSQKNSNIFEKNLLLIGIFISASIALLTIILKFNELNLFNQNLYFFSHAEDRFLNYSFPRVTGIARSLAVFSILLTYLYFLEKYKFKKIIFIIVIISLNIFIWKFQSRGAIFGYLISVMILTIFFQKINISFILLKLFLLFFIPVIISEKVLTNDHYDVIKGYFKKELIINKNIELKKKDKVEITNNKNSTNYKQVENSNNQKKIFYNSSKKIRIFETLPIIKDKTGSGRITLWKEGIKQHNWNFFGKGSLSDRYILTGNKNLDYYGNNVSNAYLYALLSGGYISLAVIIFFVLSTGIYIVKIFFVNKLKIIDLKFEYGLPICLFAFYSFRSIVENSFAIFGLDYLIFLPCIFLIKKAIFEIDNK